jgi:hypothetical protein
VLLSGRAFCDVQGECTRGLECLDNTITAAGTYSSVQSSFSLCLLAATVDFHHIAFACTNWWYYVAVKGPQGLSGLLWENQVGGWVISF